LATTAGGVRSILIAGVVLVMVPAPSVAVQLTDWPLVSFTR
jgi:hypothetical protein